MYIKGYWVGDSRVVERLVALGYLLSEKETGFEGVEIRPEHEGLFDYKPGSPHFAGELTLKGKREG